MYEAVKEFFKRRISYIGRKSKWVGPFFGSAFTISISIGFGLGPIIAFLGVIVEQYNKTKEDFEGLLLLLITTLLIIGSITLIVFGVRIALIRRKKEKEITELRKEHQEKLHEMDIEKIELVNEVSILKIQLRNLELGFSELDKAFNHIHTLQRREYENKNTEIILDALLDFCDDFVRFFERTSKNKNFKYAVCIKLTAWKEEDYVYDPKNLGTFTLSRDRVSYNSRVDNFATHKLYKNSDFQRIFINLDKHEGQYFFCNNLLKTSNRNSSFTLYGHKTFEAFKNGCDEEDKWPLPYKSCIVVPIVLNTSMLDERRKELNGFLCVDCNNIDAFDPIFHTEIVVTAAKTLYNTLKIYKEVM